MTPDIDAIRASIPRVVGLHAQGVIAALCDEIDRLRAALENDAPLANFRFRHEGIAEQATQAQVTVLRGERDAFRALFDAIDPRVDVLSEQALTVYERLSL